MQQNGFLSKQSWPAVGAHLLRIGTGLMMFIHGWPKLTGGLSVWAKTGSGIPHVIGIHFWPEFWGFLIAFIQCIGALLFALGILTRFFASALGVLMVLAAIMVFQKSGNFSAWSHPAEGAITCFAIGLMGAKPLWKWFAR